MLRYGPTRRQLVGIEAVLADGRVIRRLDGLEKDNSGFDLAGLLCGSEGTLAVDHRGASAPARADALHGRRAVRVRRRRRRARRGRDASAGARLRERDRAVLRRRARSSCVTGSGSLARSPLRTRPTCSSRRPPTPIRPTRSGARWGSAPQLADVAVATDAADGPRRSGATAKDIRRPSTSSARRSSSTWRSRPTASPSSSTMSPGAVAARRARRGGVDVRPCRRRERPRERDRCAARRRARPSRRSVVRARRRAARLDQRGARHRNGQAARTCTWCAARPRSRRTARSSDALDPFGILNPNVLLPDDRARLTSARIGLRLLPNVASARGAARVRTGSGRRSVGPPAAARRPEPRLHVSGSAARAGSVSGR